MANNSYQLFAKNVDPAATKRIVTVDVGDGPSELSFATTEDILFIVEQGKHVKLSLHDVSSNPHFEDSITRVLEFDAVDFIVHQLADPGELSVKFLGEV